MIHLPTQEARVARAYADGEDVSAIADALGMTVNTARTHVRNTQRRLDLKGYPLGNRIAFRRALREEGLLDGLPLI